MSGNQEMLVPVPAKMVQFFGLLAMSIFPAEFEFVVENVELAKKYWNNSLFLICVCLSDVQAFVILWC